MRGTIETLTRMVLILALAASLAACAAKRPPQRIQHAIQTMNRHMPEYVAEANQSLEEAKHPDRERLTGIGKRLAEALAALDRWASGGEEDKYENDSGTEPRSGPRGRAQAHGDRGRAGGREDR